MDDEPAEAEAVSTMTDALDVSIDSPSLITTVSGLTMTSSSWRKRLRRRSGAR